MVDVMDIFVRKLSSKQEKHQQDLRVLANNLNKEEIKSRLLGDGKPFLEDMRKLGLFEFFDPRHIAISADLSIRKPNPDIFLQALNALNVAPEETAMVGDSLHADILGAKQLNMVTVWKPRLHLRAELQAFQTVDNDALLAYALEYENKRYQLVRKVIKPDVIIEHVGDLLDIVQEAGD